MAAALSAAAFATGAVFLASLLSHDVSARPDGGIGERAAPDTEFFAALVDEAAAERVVGEQAGGCATEGLREGQRERQRSTFTFNDSKRRLKRLAFRTGWHTLYCDCPVGRSETNARSLSVDEEVCGYVPARRNAPRGVSWEHIMPASRFGSDRPCWAGTGCEGKRGRRCCQKSDACFNLMEGDVHNLAPALIELNEVRSNRGFGEIPGEARRFGRCDFEVQGDVAEPRPAVRGDIARSYFYMSWRYGIALSEEERAIMLKWTADDPPDSAERALNEERASLQGNDNPFVSGWKNPTF